jgi:hypothetical protein
MSKKKIFNMGRDLHNIPTLNDNKIAMTYEKASQPDLEDPFGLRDGMPGKNPRWLYMADLVILIIKGIEDSDRGVYVVKSRYGIPGQASLGEVIDIAVELLKVEFDLNIGFFEDVVAKELREAIADILHRHQVLPKKDWNKIMK